MSATNKEDRKNYFAGVIGSPYHLSVGAVVVNNQSKILCHRFDAHSKLIRDHTNLAESLDSVYLLMRETLELGESIEEGVARGLREEFGVAATVVDYLGSTETTYGAPGRPEIAKTTIYFLCQYIGELPEGRSQDDPESVSSVEWCSPDFLIKKMRQQGKVLQRSDADESVMVERAKQSLLK